jgi:hypothetical protein
MNCRTVHWFQCLFASWIGMLLMGGCQLFGGLRVESVASDATPPGQVAVYVTVSDRDAAPLQLDETNFQLAEDGKALSPDQVQLRLLPRDAAAEHHVLVLVDLSGPIQDKGALSLLSSQLGSFVERLRTQRSVSVYGFDGAPELVSLGRFEASGGTSEAGNPARAGLERVATFKQRDPSSNLNGALVAAIQQLGRTLSDSDKPVRIGSMVVIARGPDLAGRISEGAFLDALHETPYRLYSITVGTKDDQGLAGRIGPDGFARASMFENMEGPLADISRLLENDYSRYYLLSYCSPARSGRRDLAIAVERTDKQGTKQRAETYVDFDATGFASGCDSSRVPTFRAHLHKQKTANGTSTAPAAPATAQPPAEEGAPIAPPPTSGNYAL